MNISDYLIAMVLSLALSAVAAGDAVTPSASEPQLLRLLTLSKFEGPSDTRSYRIQLLREALALAPRPYHLEIVEKRISGREARALIQRQPEHWHVLSRMVDEEDYRRFQVVNFPLLKGLFGYRVALVNQQAPDVLKDIDSIEGLRALLAIQGSSWFDTMVLRHHNIPVHGIERYDRAYPMLHAQRVDYYPRSVLEVHEELLKHSNYGMQIDPHILLRYRAAMAFMLSETVGPQVAKDLRAGLDTLLERGRIDQLLQQYFGESLDRLRLSARTRIDLPNPLVPEPLKTLPAKYWYMPAETLAR